MSSGCGDVLSLEDLKIAKMHQLFEAEVITGKQGGIVGGPDIDYATNQVTGQTQKTLPAVLRDAGFRPAAFTFATGGALGVNDADLAVLWPSPDGDGVYYSWHGALPKTIPPASSPASTGGVSNAGWKPVGDLGLRADLLNGGDNLIGMAAGGTLRNAITYVTPEQFGAIGDGTVHPLSERYTLLDEAKAKYPFVTALTQTIDWAACQAAENYALGKATVQCRPYASYHFGRDGLLIDQYSQWVGVIPSTQELKVTEFKKTFPASTPVFQQDYIVRVRPGNNDSGQFYKAGIRFEGIRLRYDVARRYPTKGTNTICFHAGNMIKSNLDISTWGAEYGVYTWIHFGNKGHLRIDNCHKGYWSVPKMADNERSGSGTTTSNRYRIEADVTPFPITIGADSYSSYEGFFEGSVATDGNYDSANETACGITIIGDLQGTDFNMGIEKWEGVHVNKVGGGTSAQFSVRFGFFSDAHYLMTTGNDGSDASIRVINGTSVSKISLPNTRRAYINAEAGRAVVNIFDTNYYLGNIIKEPESTRYLCNIQDSSSIFNFIGGEVGFTPEAGMAQVSFSSTEVMKSRVTSTGCRAMDLFCSPSTSYSLVGKNKWISTTPRTATGTLDGSNGQYADFAPPNTTYSVVGLQRLYSNLGASGAAIAARPSIFSYDATTKAARVGTSYTGSTILTFTAFVELSQL